MKKGRVLAIIALIVLFITACSDSNIYREYKALCKVDGVYFTSLQEAVDYATASNSSRGGVLREIKKEITLVRDADDLIRPEKRDGVVIPPSWNGSIIFDFQDHTYLLSDDEPAIKIEGESKVVIKNGSLNSPKATDNAAIDVKGGSVEIENFSLIIPDEKTFASLEGGTLTIRSGADLSGSLTIDGSSSLIVAGGNVTLTGLEENSSDKGQILIYSGNVSSVHDLEGRVNEAVDAVPEEERGDIVISSLHSIEYVAGKEPSCIEYGNIPYYICSSCGERFEDPKGKTQITEEKTKIAPLGHDFIRVEAKEATCTEDGHMAHWCCSRCGALSSDGTKDGDISLETIKIKALGHDWSDWKNDKDSHWKECNRCGAIGLHASHSLSDWIPTEKEGYSKRTCSVCNYSEERSECDIDHVQAIPATCTENGNIEYWYCRVHHDYFKDVDLTQNISREETVIEAKGHVLRDTFSTSSGYHWHTCYNCAERIDEEAHDWKCYSEGGSHWQTCSVCKKTTVAMDYSYNEEGHWYECWINHDFQFTDPVPHNFIQDGDKLVCQQCGYIINKTGEDSGFDVIQVDPTPSGILSYVREGKTFTFTIIDMNPNSSPTQFIWLVNGEENERGEKNSFVFTPVSDGYYTVRCIFSNDKGAASATESVNTF